MLGTESHVNPAGLHATFFVSFFALSLRTHNHTASGAGAVMTPSTGLGLDGELSAPSSFGVVGTVGPNTQSESISDTQNHIDFSSEKLKDRSVARNRCR